MTKFKNFYYYNKLLSKIAIGSFIISILYIITYDIPEIYPGIGKLFGFVYNLCLAYLGAFIFYIIQVYIPNEKNKIRLKMEIYRYLFIIYGELFSAKHSHETLQFAINRDYEKLQQAYNRISLEKKPESEQEFNYLFQRNIEHSLLALDSDINTIEEYIKIIYSINITAVATNYEMIDNEINDWIEDYKKMKIKRIKYHNNIPKSELLYYGCIIGAIEELKNIYSEEEVNKKLKIKR